MTKSESVGWIWFLGFFAILFLALLVVTCVQQGSTQRELDILNQRQIVCPMCDGSGVYNLPEVDDD